MLKCAIFKYDVVADGYLCSSGLHGMFKLFY